MHRVDVHMSPEASQRTGDVLGDIDRPDEFRGLDRGSPSGQPESASRASAAPTKVLILVRIVYIYIYV